MYHIRSSCMKYYGFEISGLDQLMLQIMNSCTATQYWTVHSCSSVEIQVLNLTFKIETVTGQAVIVAAGPGSIDFIFDMKPVTVPNNLIKWRWMSRISLMKYSSYSDYQVFCLKKALKSLVEEIISKYGWLFLSLPACSVPSQCTTKNCNYCL